MQPSGTGLRTHCLTKKIETLRAGESTGVLAKGERSLLERALFIWVDNFQIFLL
jgi:hypothetical protein